MTKPATPLRAEAPERLVHTWQHVFDSGLLWYLNRTVFHPVGYALSVDGADEPGGPKGWALHYAGEPVTFADDVDEAAKLEAFGQLLAAAREHGVSPVGGVPFFAAAEDRGEASR